jgi:hypothetical protein
LAIESIRGQSMLTAFSKVWPTAPAYPVPEKVMHLRLASPISCAAAARMGAGDVAWRELLSRGASGEQHEQSHCERSVTNHGSSTLAGQVSHP